MNRNNQEEKRDITITELATEMRSGFTAVNEKLSKLDERFAGLENKVTKLDERFAGLENKVTKLDTYTRGAIETLNTKIDTVEQNLSEKIRFEISRLEDRTFSPDEKDSIMDTVKLVNDQLDANMLGKGSITLTREEYDATARVGGFPSRFERLAEIAVE